MSSGRRRRRRRARSGPQAQRGSQFQEGLRQRPLSAFERKEYARLPTTDAFERISGRGRERRRWRRRSGRAPPPGGGRNRRRRQGSDVRRRKGNFVRRGRRQVGVGDLLSFLPLLRRKQLPHDLPHQGQVHRLVVELRGEGPDQLPGIERIGVERGRLLGPAEWDSSRAVDLVEAAMAPLK